MRERREIRKSLETGQLTSIERHRICKPIFIVGPIMIIKYLLYNGTTTYKVRLVMFKPLGVDVVKARIKSSSILLSHLVYANRSDLTMTRMNLL